MVESGFNLSINDGVGCILMILLLDYPYANFLILSPFTHLISSIGLLIFCMRAMVL